MYFAYNYISINFNLLFSNLYFFYKFKNIHLKKIEKLCRLTKRSVGRGDTKIQKDKWADCQKKTDKLKNETLY